MRMRAGLWTKKGLSWLLALSMVLTVMAIAVPMATVSAGTLGQQDYEQYELETSIQLNTSRGTVTVSDEQNRTENGDRSLKVSSRTNMGGLRPQFLLTDGEKNNIWVQQGEGYGVSFWVYFPKGASDLNFRFWLCATDSTEAFENGAQKDACVLYEKNSGTGVTAGTWQRFLVPLSNCDYSGWLRLGVTTSEASSITPATFYIDDIEVMSYNDLTEEVLEDVIQAPNRALLFRTGNNVAYWNTSKGAPYAAMRVIGEYVCADGNASKAICDGMTFDILERGILLGNASATPANLLYDSCMQKTSVSGKELFNYWNYDDSTGTVEFTMLLKVPKGKKDTVYSYRSYLKLDISGVEVTVYSSLHSLSIQSLYNNVCAAVGRTLNWYDDIGKPAETFDNIPFKDGFDSRFAVVYPAGDAAAQAAAETLKTGLAEVMGKNVFSVPCYSDATADTGKYEILVGNTNRDEDNEAVSYLAARPSKYDAAFMYHMNNKKLAIEARNADNERYAYALNLAAENFVEQYGTLLSVPSTLYFCSSTASENTGGKSLFVGASGNSDLLNNAQIIVEKYPSYMTLSAAKDVQKVIALLSGQYVSIVKYQGDEHTGGVSILIGPKQGAVKAIYDDDGYISGVDDNGLLKFESDTPLGKTGSGAGTGYDDGEFSIEEDDENTYRIMVSGEWPNYVVQVNGGSMYAINAGVQALISTMKQDRYTGGSRTGRYDGSYSLSGGYGLTYNEEFNYTTEADIRENWTVDGDTTDDPTGNLQERPGEWGPNGTFYDNDGYLYEYTKKSDTGYYAVRLTTNEKMTYRYGFTEVRMIAGTDNGACSAVWLRSSANPHVEIDVYENFGRDQMKPTLHYWEGAENTYQSGDAQTLKDGHFYDTFHYIAYEWDDTSISFYIDGESYLTIPTTKGWGKITQEQMAVTHQPCWLIIANGVGTPGYTNGYDPEDYVYKELTWLEQLAGKTSKYHAPEGGKYDFRNINQFKETQVIDYVYIFQKNDGVSYVQK